MSGGAIAQAIAGLITGLVDSGISIDQNTRNIHAQRNALNFNKMAGLLSMMREDNAVQRRVADLKKAGLSPTLAAGSAASTGPSMKIEPMKYGLDLDLQQRTQQLVNFKNQQELMRVQTENIQEQTLKTRQQRELDLLAFPERILNLKSQTTFTNHQSALKYIQRLMDEISLKSSAGSGIAAKGASLLGGNLRDLATWLNTLGTSSEQMIDNLGKNLFKRGK